MWPDEGREKLEISPSSQSSGKLPSSTALVSRTRRETLKTSRFGGAEELGISGFGIWSF